jgi:RNA polymerase sigma-70 factor (ECF subfamily)
LQEHRATGRLRTGRIAPTNEVEEALVQGYVDAWHAADTRKLASLLKEDVVLTMPPLPLRFAGREAVTDFYAKVPFATRDRFRLISTRANRQPALAVYRFDSTTDTYRGVGIWVLTIDGDAIAEITTFIDPQLLPAFGLPNDIQPD